MPCEQTCVNEVRLKAIEEELKELKDKNSTAHGEFYHRIRDLEKDNVQFRNDIEHIKSTMDEMNDNIKTLMAVPGKRYETAVACALTAVISTLVGFLLNGILPM